MWKSLFSLCARRRAVSYPWLDSQSSFPELQQMAQHEVIDTKKLQSFVQELKLRKTKFPENMGGRVGYIPLIEDRLYTLCVFFLPKGTVMPFHDHPRQHVALRVLEGELKIDVCDIEPGKPVFGLEYKIVKERSLVARPDSPVLIVKPQEENIHEITAVNDSLFLDLVLPPYGRDRAITYFKRTTGGKLKAVSERDIDLPMEFCDVRNLISSINPRSEQMLFFQLFQQLAEQKAPVKVELKNDIAISGQLQSVDQYLNVKLANVSIDNPDKYPHLVSLRNCFIRGSVVRYIHLLPTAVNVEKLEDDCRREAKIERNSRKAATA